MKILILGLSIFVFIRALTYGIYEIKTNNKSGGIFVIIFSCISAIIPNVIIYINGIN